MSEYTLNDGTKVNAVEWAILRKINAIGGKAKLKADGGYWNAVAGAGYKHIIKDLRERGLITTKINEEDDVELSLSRRLLPSFKPNHKPMTPGMRRPLVTNAKNQDPGDIVRTTLTNQANTPVYANELMVKKIAQNWQWDSNTPKEVIKSVKALKQWVTKHGTHGPIHSDAFADWRGRINLASGTFGSYQQNKLMRSVLDGPTVDVSQDSDEYQYFLTLIDEEYGVTEDNFSQILKAPIATPKDALTFRAALAIAEIKSKGETGYLMEQDATCSGGQIIALLSGDKELARLTNVTITDTKQDLYRHIAEQPDCLAELHRAGVTDPRDIRNAAKPIVMVAFYGGHVASIVNNIWLDNGGEFEVMEMDSGPDEVPCGTIEWCGTTWTLDTIMPVIETLSRKIDRFPGFRAIKSHCSKWFNNSTVDKCGTLKWTTANGMEISRYVESGGGTMPNFIHSIDGAIVQRTTNQCADEGVYLLTVHDAFVTTIPNALKVADIVRQQYRDVIRETPLPEVPNTKLQRDDTLLDNVTEALVIGEHRKAAAVAV